MDLLNLFGNFPSSGAGSTFSVSYENGSTVPNSSDTPQNLPGSTFFGVRSATAITSLTIQGPGVTELGLDNFEFGSPQQEVGETPEVATFLLIGTGLCMMRFLRKRFPQKESRGEVCTMSTGSTAARWSTGPSKTTSASVPC